MFRKKKEDKTPEKFLDYISGKLMSDPVLVNINDELKVVDSSSAFLKNYKGDIQKLPKLKAELENWKKSHETESKTAEENKNRLLKLKIVLIGDSFVGKTQIFNRFQNRDFKTQYKPSYGTDINILDKQINGEHLKVSLYDLVYDKRADLSPGQYVRGADAVIFIFDVCKVKTFENIETYFNELKYALDENCIKLLVGNKIDVDIDNRFVSGKRAKAFASEHQMEYIEVSAKDNSNIDQLFIKATEQALIPFRKTEFQSELVNKITDIISNLRKESKSILSFGMSNKANEIENALNRLLKLKGTYWSDENKLKSMTLDEMLDYKPTNKEDLDFQLIDKEDVMSLREALNIQRVTTKEKSNTLITVEDFIAERTKSVSNTVVKKS